MSVFNGSAYLNESIESILNQTFKDFEFLILDDGSTDNSFEIIKKYSSLDSRIKHFRQKNMGLTRALNFLVKKSRNNFIARMDADDFSENIRLEHQYFFLKKNPDYSVVGSNSFLVDKYNYLLKKTKLPSSNFLIKTRLNYINSFIHSSIMFRKSKFNEAMGYDESIPRAQDFDLWLRMSKLKNSKFKNLKKHSHSLRMHDESISKKDSHFQMLCAVFALYRSKVNKKIKFDLLEIKNEINSNNDLRRIYIRYLFIYKNFDELYEVFKERFSIEGLLLLIGLYFRMKFDSK